MVVWIDTEPPAAPAHSDASASWAGSRILPALSTRVAGTPPPPGTEAAAKLPVRPAAAISCSAGDALQDAPGPPRGLRYPVVWPGARGTGGASRIAWVLDRRRAPAASGDWINQP